MDCDVVYHTAAIQLMQSLSTDQWTLLPVCF